MAAGTKVANTRKEYTDWIQNFAHCRLIARAMRSDVMKTLYVKSAVTVLAISLALAGCASTTSVLQGWVGAPESELLRSWGGPNLVTESTGGVKEFEYAEEWFITVPDRLSDLPGQLSTLEYVEHRFWCRTRFEISGEGTIVGFRFEGNKCDPIKRR